MRRFQKKLPLALMLLGVLSLFTFSASAYVDPTTTTFLAQAIASIAAILGSALVIVWRKVRKKVYRFLGIDQNRNKAVEPEFAVLTPDEVKVYNEEVRVARQAADLAAKEKYAKKHEIGLPYRKRFLYSFVSLLFLSGTVLFLAPAEVYLGNYNDFFFPLTLLCKVMLPISVLLSLILASLLAIVRGKAWYYVTAVPFGLGFCCYVQGLALNGKMGTLSGFADSYATSTVVFNLVIWAILLAGLIVGTWFSLCKKAPFVYKTVLCTASALLIFMQTVGVMSAAGNTRAERSTISYSVISDEGETELAQENNVVVFILDTAGYDYMEAALEKYPDLFSELDGFTYYPDAVSRYSRTYPSIPYLLSHEDCDFDEPFGTFLKEAYTDSTFLSFMKESGTSVGVYTENQLLSESILSDLDNCSEDGMTSMKPESIFDFAWRIGQVSLYREMPYLCKTALRYDSEAINGDVINAHSHFDYEITFRKAVAADGISVDDDASSAFRFFHFNGPHPGTFLRADGTFGVLPTEDMSDAVRGDFTIIDEYLSALKEAGLYDSTTVIITADHGHSFLGTSTDLSAVRTAAMLMLVKPQNARGECKTSAAPVCHEDLFTTVYRGLGIAETAFGQGGIEDVSEDSDRVRTYYYSALFSDEDGEIAKLEYNVQGPAYELSSYTYTGHYWDINYSTRAVSKTRFSPNLFRQ